MKYRELQQIVKETDYHIEKNNFRTILIEEGLKGDYKNEITISEIEIGVIDICMSLLFPWDFKVAKAAMDYATTPPEEREDEKRYIIPLPHLTTCDGEQLFLTHQGNFFPCRRNKGLRQTWKEKDLVHIPEEYRGFAIEIEVEKWNYK